MSKLEVMNPHEINKFLKARPFTPFRVHTSDGKTFEINDPKLAFLTGSALIIGRPVADPVNDIPARSDSVSPLHIVRLEPLVAS